MVEDYEGPLRESPLARAERLNALRNQEGSREDADRRLDDELGDRQADRYRRLLDGPVELQRAVDVGDLSLRATSELLGLPFTQRVEGLDRLRAGESPRCVFEAYCGRNAPPRVYRDLVKLLDRCLDTLEALTEQDALPVVRKVSHAKASEILIRAAEEMRCGVKSGVSSTNCSSLPSWPSPSCPTVMSRASGTS